MNYESPPSKDVLIKMLGYALVEIRSSDEIETIRALADIFHNLPGSLISWKKDSNESTYNEVIKKAKKWKLENYICELRKLAESSERNRMHGDAP